MQATLAPIIRFLHRYHLTLFIVLVAGSLAFVAFSLLPILSHSSGDTPTDQTTTQTVPSLNKKTIDQVEKLQPSGTPSQLPNYTGRTNPFGE